MPDITLTESFAAGARSVRRVHYQFDGPADAPVVLLSNSLGTNMSMWSAQLPALTARYRVLRYDTRGHGGSTATPGPLSIDQLGRDVVDLLDALDLAAVDVVGLSLGGMTGMWLARHAPHRLRTLALCNTAAYIGPRAIWDGRIAAVRAGGMGAIVDAVLERWFTAAFRASAPARIAPIREGLLATPAEGYIAACAAIREMDQREAVRTITLPTLVITGTHDPSTPPADGRFLGEQIRGARYAELPCAHLSNIEQTDEFNRALLTFLNAA